MATILGTNLKISNANVAIEDLQECSLNMTKTVIDATTKDSGGWREIQVGTKSGTLSFTALVDPAATEGFEETVADFIADTAISWKFDATTGTATQFTGSGYVTAIDYSGNLDEMVSYSGTIEVTGVITQNDDAT